ncbi:MAG: YdcF family protein [Patescibacteria group bacterium]|nr:YdcF family protein [Patescibacteria group bacterium]
MRKILKIFKITALAAAVLFLVSFSVVFGVGQYHCQIPEKADAIIVLGAAINTPALYNRSMQGLRLYQQGKGAEMILSGGRISDQDISEAQYMKKVIEKNSARPVPLILEQNSHSTFENIKNSKALDPQAKSLVIVSDRFHLARAALVAKRNGFGPVYWSAPDPFYYSKSDLIYYYFRETAALVWYLPKLVFN